ncbi:hypothetical protein BM525_20115 (plasmid) [Alteromonas mediterranea]|uniref:cysteine desulfurase n=1 Tax=Alteromonas mediterranea TaxID=314275 RepID=A0AAC9JDV4_9ALTE|nr:aminotransferase class V-fold PLP-dependent enzyme [Alteromonas mediterranea]APD92189.1 hypothetical protein BM524_19920 [Alteromonas mediterranea]APE00044.1 hypothetical protein BM525_20115 [Alteromonas mediterranea]
MKLPIYLDYAATTPISPKSAKAICDTLSDPALLGNPSSSTHMYGWKAQEAVHAARARVASLFNAKARDVIFTSGATEANNLAIRGVCQGLSSPHIITSSVEHKAVLETCQHMARNGAELTILEPDENGIVTPESVASAIKGNTVLVSLMHVNNEVGSFNDIDAIGELISGINPNIVFHVDAAQSAGKVDIDIKSLAKIDIITFSAHKFYGPKGIGGLILSRFARKKVSSISFGGVQENSLRPGTLATHQIVGMGEAAAECKEKMSLDREHVLLLRQTLFNTLNECGVAFNTNVNQNLAYPGIVNMNIFGIEPDELMLQWSQVAVSSGSACNSQTKSDSYVLQSIRNGKDKNPSSADVRISFGRYTTREDVTEAVHHLTAALSAVSC